MRSLLKVMAAALLLPLAACEDGTVGGDGPCTPTNGGVEACHDSIDNDCDGQVDEGCCEPTNGGIEVCDGEDNDCDGETDEDACSTGDCTAGETRGCGVTPDSGACVETCSSGAWGACEPTGSDDEICGDEIDNNCDGTVDEFCECTPGEERECGGSPESDLCAEVCGDGGQWSSCSPKAPNTGEELCDGLDNDCDGTIDNGDCDCDIDAEPRWCGATPERHSCQQVCDVGEWSACAPVDGEDVEEACGDGEDNDCDGAIDEPEPCTFGECGEGEARCAGTERGECSSTAWPCRPGEEETEDCDGNDTGECDPGTHNRSCGSDCQWDGWGACEGVVSPDSEDCNGLDDDCDGTVDEDVSPGDDYGSNSSCATAHHLGTDPDTVVYAYTTGDNDWFQLTAVDNTTLFGGETIEIELIPPSGVDLDLYLYQFSCSGYALESSVASGDATDSVYWEEEGCMFGECPTEEGEYYIYVENVFGGSGCYELRVNGLN